MGAETRVDDRSTERLVRDSGLFDGCTGDDIAEVVEISELRSYAPGEDIVREGEAAHHFFLLKEGEVAVLKGGSAAAHEISRLGAGDNFGELALLDPGARTATVRALTPVTALAIPISRIVTLAAERPHFVAVLIALARQVLSSLLVLRFMRRTGYPPSFFGLSLRDGWRHAVEALLLTLPLMVGAVLLKLLLVAWIPVMHGRPVFDMLGPGGSGLRLGPGLIVAYIVLVPFQELIYRGALQGGLEHFLVGPGRTWKAILGANIIFSAAHLYISSGLSLVAFLAGLFWGWLYSRQRTLVGVSISHVVLGLWAFEVVGLGILE